MKEATITVTEAARNFADCVNRAHYQQTTFVLLKNGKPFARIEPDHEKRCTGRDLAEAMAGADLSVEEAHDWHRDLVAARKTPQNPGRQMRGAYDLVLAATALERGSQVATFNRRHFDVVPGLKVVEPH